MYELHLTNLRAVPLEVTRVEVLREEDGSQLAAYQDAELSGRLARPGAPNDLPDKRVIGGGMRAVLFVQIVLPPDADPPRALRHRLTFKSAQAGSTADGVIDGAVVAVRRVAPLMIDPPLGGDRWLAANGLSNDSSHRRALVVVDGRARIAQRFATDWTRIGPDGQAFHDNPAQNANWYAYGATVLAVASGVVVDVKDGIPENDPTSDTKAVPITLETAGGNYVILDLGAGRFAFYAHLQPKSIHVKMGDRVARGRVIALLGNSGNSDAPHLHFHISDRNSPLGAEGLPYVLRSFDVQGMVKSLQVLNTGEGWKPQADAAPQLRTREMPIQNSVVRFP